MVDKNGNKFYFSSRLPKIMEKPARKAMKTDFPLKQYCGNVGEFVLYCHLVKATKEETTSSRFRSYATKLRVWTRAMEEANAKTFSVGTVTKLYTTLKVQTSGTGELR